MSKKRISENFPIQMHNLAYCQDLCAILLLLLQLLNCNKSLLNLTVALKWVAQLGVIRVGISLTKPYIHMYVSLWICLAACIYVCLYVNMCVYVSSAEFLKCPVKGMLFLYLSFFIVMSNNYNNNTS